MTIYRLTRAKYADTAFTGVGALKSAGRWHRMGTPVVYASDTPAGALLEVVAHTEAVALLGHAYVLFTVELDPARHLLTLDPPDLPSDWREPLWPASTQRIGTRWFEDADSVVLRVPSAIVPMQHNFLVNPAHPLFGELVVTGPTRFAIDPRLAG